MSRFIALALAAMALALPASAADPKFDAEACAKAVAPYLDDQTVAVLHVNLAALNVDDLLNKAAAIAKMDADALSPLRRELKTLVKALTDAGAHELYVVVSLADLPERSPFVVVPLAPPKEAKNDTRMQQLQEAFKKLAILQYVPCSELIGDNLVAGDRATVKRVLTLKPNARPELVKALAAADGDLVQLAIMPPKGAAKILESMMPTMPAEVGGGSSKVLTQGFRWAALGVDAPSLDLSMTVQASDADAAKALLELHDKVFAAIGKSLDAREMLLLYFYKLMPMLRPKVDGDRLTLKLEMKPLMTALHAKEAVAKIVEASERTKSSNNMTQLGLAAFNYLDKYGAFPPAYTADKDGKRLLSWRVHVLPFLEQDKLYKEFHLDEPWDSDHN
ncbi:MAG TPA: hypothetical protein DDY78_15010, partial [Planctomycetales bacterium]|nr:hypothetical protein [Planctomycetales bacterium]